MAQRFARTRTSSGFRDQPDLKLERDSIGRERECEEAGELGGRGREHGRSKIFVIERYVAKSELHALELDSSECADCGARAWWMGISAGSSFDVNISNIADEDMRRMEIERRDVEVLKNELDIRVFIFGPAIILVSFP
jgi:hypothetical protein